MFTPWVFAPYSGQGLSFNIRDTPSATTLRRTKENNHYVSFQVALSHVFGEVICRDVNLLAFGIYAGDIVPFTIYLPDHSHRN